jgi:hypothetical protein
MLRLIVIAALLLHGIGHVLFLANAWGYWTTTAGRSWLFADRLGLGQTVGGVIGLLWLLPVAGFLLGAWALINHQEMARPWLLAAAALSLGLIVLWWGSLVTGSAFFALVVDLAIIGWLLWRPETLLAART